MVTLTLHLQLWDLQVIMPTVQILEASASSTTSLLLLEWPKKSSISERLSSSTGMCMSVMEPQMSFTTIAVSYTLAYIGTTWASSFLDLWVNLRWLVNARVEAITCSFHSICRRRQQALKTMSSRLLETVTTSLCANSSSFQSSGSLPQTWL